MLCGAAAMVQWPDAGPTNLTCALVLGHAELEHEQTVPDPQGRDYVARWPAWKPDPEPVPEPTP